VLVQRQLVLYLSILETLGLIWHVILHYITYIIKLYVWNMC